MRDTVTSACLSLAYPTRLTGFICNIRTLHGFVLNDVCDLQPAIIAEPRLNNTVDLVDDCGIGGDFVLIINGESNTSHLDMQKRIHPPIVDILDDSSQLPLIL